VAPVFGGVIGVVRVLDADAHNTSRGPKVQISTVTPFFFLSEQSRMSTLSVQKIWAKKLLIILRNSEKHIWPHWSSSEVTEKQKPGKRSCVIVLDTPLTEITRAVLSPGNRAKPCKFRYVKSVRNFMWKLHYREDRAMRLIRGCPDNFRSSLTTPTATIPRIFHGLLFRSTYECSCKIWSP